MRPAATVASTADRHGHAEHREERVRVRRRSAAPKATPETDRARAAPRESAIEIAEELKPRSRSVEASSIATLVRG